MKNLEILSNEKKCTRCKKIKDRSEFPKDSQKKDGLSSYCKKCTSIIYKLKRREEKLEHDAVNDINEIISQKPIDLLKSDEQKEIELNKYNTTVEHLAKLVAKQYGGDIKKADEVYELFFEKILSGDTSQSSKEALTKSLELRMSASNSLLKLIQSATKLQETREKSNSNFNFDNIKNALKK